VPPQPSRNGHVAPAAQRVIGLSAEVRSDGVHLELNLPPNRRGITSPITSLVSTRQHDKDGTIYERTTASDSLYLVSMPDERARQILGTFYAWKNGAQACRRPRHGPRPHPAAPSLGKPSCEGAHPGPRMVAGLRRSRAPRHRPGSTRTSGSTSARFNRATAGRRRRTASSRRPQAICPGGAGGPVESKYLNIRNNYP
jgi:hypothetical protein